MKEFIEEYGGVITACFMGLLLLGFLSELTAAGGGLSQLAKIFMESTGALWLLKIHESEVSIAESSNWRVWKNNCADSYRLYFDFVYVWRGCERTGRDSEEYWA